MTNFKRRKLVLSDCIKCWDTPCTCGYEYRNYDNQKLINMINNMMKYKTNEDKKEILAKLLDEIGD